MKAQSSQATSRTCWWVSGQTSKSSCSRDQITSATCNTRWSPTCAQTSRSKTQRRSTRSLVLVRRRKKHMGHSLKRANTSPTAISRMRCPMLSQTFNPARCKTAPRLTAGGMSILHRHRLGTGVGSQTFTNPFQGFQICHAIEHLIQWLRSLVTRSNTRNGTKAALTRPHRP